MQASLARVVIGGLLASTLITLVLIPALYISANAVTARAGAFSSRQMERVRRRWSPAES